MAHCARILMLLAVLPSCALDTDSHLLSLDGDDEVKCPDGIAANGSCYVYFAESVNWVVADVVCAERGGYLATVTDAAENELVTALVDGAAWIGLSHNGDSFEWITGETLRYQNWQDNSPWEQQNCVRIVADGQWDDSECDSLSGRDNPFVCEFDLVAHDDDDDDDQGEDD